MQLFLFAIVLLIIGNSANKTIKKRFWLIFSIATLYSLIPIGMMVASGSVTAIQKSSANWYGVMAVHSPIIGSSMYLVVAFASKVKSKFKNIMTIRTEYSIIGLMLILGHIAYQLLAQFEYGAVNLISLALPLTVIMIVLWVTSFKRFKIKLKARWKKLHKLAYIAYPLIIIHAMVDKQSKELSEFVLLGDYDLMILMNNIIYFLIIALYIVLSILCYNNYRHQSSDTNKIKTNVNEKGE